MPHIQGTDGPDVLHGGPDPDTIHGEDGNDQLFGEGGDDTLDGDIGGGTAEQDGNDILYGGDGNDTLFSQWAGTDNLNGGADNDFIYLGVSKDHLGLYISQYVNNGGYPLILGVASGDDGDDVLRGGVWGTSFFGGSGNDTIAAHAGNDVIDGGSDNDLIVAGTGADTIFGGSGNDAIYTFGTLPYGFYAGSLSEGWEQGSINPYGDTDIDTVDAGAGMDYIYASAGDQIDGGADADSLILSVRVDEASAATLFNGGAGNDRASVTIGELQQHSGANGVDFFTPITFALDPTRDVKIFGLTLRSIEAITFYSGDGDDEITGWIFDDYIDGKRGSDALHGGAGNDQLYGGLGNDTLDGGPGTDLLDGGADTDTADYSGYPFALPVTVNLVNGTAQITQSNSPGANATHTLVSIENIIGTAKDDFIEGNDEANRLEGRAGDDFLIGGGGADTLIGGDYNDIVHGGDGKDILEGGEGSDTLLYWDYDNADLPLLVNLAADFSNADTISGFENISGSALNDEFMGNSERNVLLGMDGNDKLHAYSLTVGLPSSWDVLDGGEGEDRLTGSVGPTILAGGNGHDTIVGGHGDDAMFGGAAPSDIFVFFGGQSVDPTDVDVSILEAYDAVNTDTTADELSGGLGKDLIVGARGGDHINGDGDADKIWGGDGNDIIDGGEGLDKLWGGAGRDTFLMRTFDRGFYDQGRGWVNETIVGGGGVDTLDFSELGVPVSVYIHSFINDPYETTIRANYGEVQYPGWRYGDVVNLPYLRSGDVSEVENFIGSTGNDEFSDESAGNPANRFEGRGGQDILDGGGGNDHLLGGADNDTLIGGSGDDTLEGGSGIDTAKFTGPRSAYTITRSANTTTVAGPDGTDTLISVEKLVFDDKTASNASEPPRWSASVDVGPHPAGWLPSATGDFNNDGTSDVLWFNAANGNADLWKVANGQWAGSVDIGAHPPGYQLQASGDFNADGTADVFWFNPTTGDTDVWKIANGQWAGSTTIGLHPLGWQPAGSGDFNNDGTDDVLWFNPATGNTEVWKVHNGQWAGTVDIGVHPAGYTPAGVGDFDGDGTADVFWFNPTTGDTDIWKIVDGRWAGSTTIGVHPAGWTPAGVGDFNGDGTDDVVWFNAATGNIDIWLVENRQWLASANIGDHPLGWSPAGIGDFNSDDISDILWREASTNRIETWLLGTG